MSDSLIDLTLRIGTQLADLQQGVNSAGKTLDGLAGKVQSVGKIIAGAFTVTAIIGAGKAVFDFSQEIGEATSNVKGLTGVIDKDLVSSTAKILAISKTFDKDFNSVLLSANAASKQLGVTLPVALDGIEKGLAIAGLQGDEFLEIVKEYPSALNGAGISAEEFFAVASQSVTDGTFSDKGIDTIKEASLRLREMTPATKDALTAIGLSSTELQKGLQDGTLTMFQAIQRVGDRLKDFKDDSQVTGQVLADVFGGAGEDVGVNFIKNLGTINTDLDSLVANLDEGSKAQLRLSEATTEWNKVFVNLFGTSSVGFDNLKANAIEVATKGIKAIRDGVIDVSNYFIDLYNNSVLFRSAVQGIVFVFKQGWEAIKLFWKIAVDAFSTVGKLISAVLKGDFSEIKGIVSDAFSSMADSAVEYGKNTATNFVDGANATLNAKPIELISKTSKDNAINEVNQIAGQISNTISNAMSGSGSAPAKDHNKSAGPKQQDRIAGGATGALSAPTTDADSLIKNIELTNQWAEALEAKRLKDLEILELAQMYEGVITSTMDAASASIEAGQSAWKVLGNTIKAEIKKIIKAFIAQGIAGVVSRTLGTVGGPWGVALAAIAGAAAGALFSSIIPGFANGTNFAPGGLSLVGEMGPELVNLPRGSKVHTNGESMRMFSGGGYGGELQLTTRISGQDIIFVVAEANRRK